MNVRAQRTAERAEIVQLALAPQAPFHLSEGFSVSLEGATPLDALDLPAPSTEAGPFPAYVEPLTVSYRLPESAAHATMLTLSFQLCDDQTCYFPETMPIPIEPAAGASPAPTPVAIAPVAAPPAVASPAETSIPVTQLFEVHAEWNGYATPEQFLDFLSAAPEMADATAGPARAMEEATATDSGAWRRFLDDPAKFYRASGFGWTVLLILLGGFLLNLTPCVLPMIPVNLAIIGAASSSGASRGTRFGLGLAYGMGMAAVYGGLGLAVVRSGGVFGALNASPIFTAGMAVLFLALGLAMFDWWQLDFSRFRRAGSRGNRARFPAAIAMGGLSALLAGACVAPVLIAVLALAGHLYAAGQTRALALPFLLGAGMALPWPFVAAGLSILPKPGAWMGHVKKGFGVLIIGLAVMYGFNAVSLFRADRATETPHAPPGFIGIDLGRAEDAARMETLLREAHAQGRTVLVDYGARWCKVCVWMTRTTLRDPAITEAIRPVVALAVLADDPSAPAAAPWLRTHRVNGYPAFRLLRPVAGK